jgi:hypothetical protein
MNRKFEQFKNTCFVQNKDIINKISTFIDSQEQLKKMKLN